MPTPQVRRPKVRRLEVRRPPMKVQRNCYLSVQAWHRAVQGGWVGFSDLKTSRVSEPSTCCGAAATPKPQNLKSLNPYKKWQQLRTQTDFPTLQVWTSEGGPQGVPALAAQVTVGFQKRLANCRAAERLEHDLAVQEAVDAPS